MAHGRTTARRAAGDVLGEGRSHEADALPYPTVGAVRADPEPGRRERHQRDHRERREGEPPVEDEEDDRRSDEEHHVLDERRDAVRDQRVERLDVVRDPADDRAGAVALEVPEGEALQVLEQANPEVGERALPTQPVR